MQDEDLSQGGADDHPLRPPPPAVQEEDLRPPKLQEKGRHPPQPEEEDLRHPLHPGLDPQDEDLSRGGADDHPLTKRAEGGGDSVGQQQAEFEQWIRWFEEQLRQVGRVKHSRSSHSCIFCGPGTISCDHWSGCCTGWGQGAWGKH